jgi:adenine-specific DNA-methyltransferase
VFEDANTLVGSRPFDVLYLDPPYNTRSYAHYYHLPESIASGMTPSVRGASGIPDVNVGHSDFNRPAKATDALRAILSRARFRLLVVHYSDQGLIPPKTLRQLLGQFGKVRKRTISAKGYTTKHLPRQTPHALYLVRND